MMNLTGSTWSRIERGVDNNYNMKTLKGVGDYIESTIQISSLSKLWNQTTTSSVRIAQDFCTTLMSQVWSLAPYEGVISSGDYIGGSEAASIMGCGYNSAITVYMQKTQQEDVPDLSGLEHIEWGNMLEPVVLKRTEEMLNLHIERAQLHVPPSLVRLHDSQL